MVRELSRLSWASKILFFFLAADLAAIYHSTLPFPLYLRLIVGGMGRASRRCLLLLAMGGAGPQLVDAGCNVIALSRKGAPANAPSWAKSVKWVEGNALVSVCQTTEPWSIHALDKIQHVHTSGFRVYMSGQVFRSRVDDLSV